MLKQAWDFGKQLLSLTNDTQQNKADIKSLREDLREARREIADCRHELSLIHQSMMQVHRDMNEQRLEFAELTRLVERLAFELKHQRENAEREREMHELRLQNILLRGERGLPPGNSAESEP